MDRKVEVGDNVSDFLIEMNGVEVSYPKPDGGKAVIVDQVNLNVRAGELVTLVGPSGCGKSTLLRLVLGSNFPSAGSVSVDGKRVERVSRDCGIVYQHYSLFPQLTVLENVALGPVLEQTGVLERLACAPLAPLARLAPGLADKLRFFRVSRQARELACEMLVQCGLDPVVDGGKYPNKLSGGMKQRTAIAQALAMRPKILLMDEPFSGLDSTTRSSMQDFVHEQWERHKLTVFFVTHDLDEACKLGTRLLCLSQYWLNEDGSEGAGARIMIDRAVAGGSIRPSEFQGSAEFEQLTGEIKQKALTKGNRQRLSSFMLHHPDAAKQAAK